MEKLNCRVNLFAAWANATHILSLRLNGIIHKAFPNVLKWINKNEVKEKDTKEQEEKKKLTVIIAKLSAWYLNWIECLNPSHKAMSQVLLS